MVSKLKSDKTVLPGELVVAVFFRLGTEQLTEFNQDVLCTHFDLAADRWRGSWTNFAKSQSGSSGFDEVAVELLHGGSLMRDPGLKNLRPTTHTLALGSYGQACYDELPPILREQVDHFVRLFIRDQQGSRL